MTDTPILVSGRHGDYGPWNAIANHHGVTVIDFFGYREDPLPVDILSVLVMFDSIKYGLANSAARLDALAGRFLAGIGSLPDLPAELVLLCEAQQRMLRLAGAVDDNPKRPIRWPETWERSRSITANVAWFSNRPKVSSLWP